MLKHSLIQKQFDFLIIYYWTIQVFSFIWIETSKDFRFSFFYFATVLPILIFLGINFPWKIFSRGLKKINLPLYIYILLVTLISLARFDYATAYNIIIFSLAIIIIIENNLTINIKLINTLFILTIIFGIYSYHASINPYGYLPLQGEHSYYFYRISLFPKAVVGSAFFAFFVAMINYFFNKGRSRWLFFMVGLYFTVLSANRTVLVCLFFVFCFMLLTKLFSFRKSLLYCIFIPVVICILAIALYSPSVFLRFSDLQMNQLNYIVYHNISGIQSEEYLDKINRRPLIWGLHYQLFMEAPWFGKGSYKLGESYSFSGSESFLTGLLARVGLMVTPFMLFFLGLVRRSMISQNRFLYGLLFCIFVIMLSYGSFMVPYSFLFLLMFGLINMNSSNAVADNSKHVPKRQLMKRFAY